MEVKKIVKVYAVIIDNKKLLVVRAPNGVVSLPGCEVPRVKTNEQALKEYLKENLGITFTQSLPQGQYVQDAFDDMVMQMYLLLVNRYEGTITPKVECFWASKKELESGEHKLQGVFKNNIIRDLSSKMLI